MDNKIMELENEIEELKLRIIKLENKEKKKRIWNIIRIILKIVVLFVTLIFMYYGYNYVKSNYIDKINNINDTIDSVKNYNSLWNFDL